LKIQISKYGHSDCQPSDRLKGKPENSC